jgi:hypothetical protein
VIPQLRAWHEKYEQAGLTIVGVHTPEFFWEKPYANSAIWKRFGIWAWPTAVIVDKRGIVRHRHIGEGAYEETESEIRRLLAEKE